MTAISLDLDETLWRLDGVLEHAEEATVAFLREHYPAIAEAYPPERMRVLRDQVARENPELAYNVTALRIRTFEQAAKAVGAPLRAAEEAFEVFIDARHRVELYPDAMPVLEGLYREFPLVALTNGNADVHRLALGHYFVAAYSAVHVGAAKPSRPMFEAAARGSGVPIERLIHVGDDPETDVSGAARHGLRAIWLNRSGALWPEYLPKVNYEEIRTLDELPGLIER
ncbi:HAD-IA family hydrolase [Aquisalimonas sp. 2447]|uniref:HAD family hydrolase n=1 Tax=Aquisalimonas sp. 2447 TaxID=2740807 RepID=UPI0014326D8B|nr:HAD-IA family hydrolase [Aquisalimonas sp. 2447]QIT54407.1 HAD-IA family hydrolase [Aquisalimonas sp. 2447]